MNILDSDSALHTITKITEEKRNKTSIQEPAKPNYNNALLYILSGFSILFGISVVTVIPFDVTGVIISIFLLFVFIINEYYKTQKLQDFFETQNQTSLIISIVTLLISFCSLYGIYINVNNIDKATDSKQANITKLENNFNKQKDSLNYALLKVDSILSISPSYLSNVKQLDQLRSERSKENNKYDRNLEYFDTEIEKLSVKIEEERQTIKKSISTTFNEVKVKYKEELKALNSSTESTNSRILILSIIAVILSLVVELSIVGLCRYRGISNKAYKNKLTVYLEEKAKLETEQRNALMRLPEKDMLIEYVKHIEAIFLVKKENDKITKEDIEKVILNSRLSEKAFEDFYQKLKILGIIGGQTSGQTIIVNREKAIKLLDDYFTNIIKNKLKYEF